MFRTVIPWVEHINEPVNEPVKFTKTQKAILDALREYANISKKELSDITGRSRSTITRNLAQLVKNGSIERIGSDKKGHWKITLKKTLRRTK
ncbi:MAG: winged helix-turn-helix transcriptional regulator [Caldisericia bacterium]|nr:winged helix-turn-helix transcriptional regulator [Caldisericia bacterium]